MPKWAWVVILIVLVVVFVIPDPSGSGTFVGNAIGAIFDFFRSLGSGLNG